MSTHVKAERGSVMLGFELCSDEKGRPLCRHAESDFRCQALCPKMFNARGDLVHYCGLAEPGQLPLLETSVKHGIVRPRKNKCWLRHGAVRGGASSTHGTVDLTKAIAKPVSTLHQIGYVMARHIYLDTREFCHADIQAMEDDFARVRHELDIQRVQSDVKCVVRALCGLQNAKYTKWATLMYHCMLLEHSNINNPGLRITPTKAWGYLCMSPCETKNGLVYHCVVLRVGGVRVCTTRTHK